MHPSALLSLVVALVWAGSASAQSAPAAAASAPSDRAQRDADKVFRMILMHADKPRRAATRDDKVAAPARPSAAAPESWISFPYLTAVMVLLTLVSIFHVWSRVEVIDLNLKTSEASRQFREEEQENKRLKLEVASLKTPARIEALAKGELGMTLPTDQQVVLVK